MRKRVIILALVGLLLAAGIGGFVAWRLRQPPAVTRLLPFEADAVIYISLQPLRMATGFGRETVSREPEYEGFVGETGIQFERDLDEVAIAVHAPEAGANPSPEHRYSEVFVGRYDSARLAKYLRKLAQQVEKYRDQDIFVIPYEGRTVRAVLLGPGMVGVSNTLDSAPIHTMVDRYQKQGLPIGGPRLVYSYYRQVPLGSNAWAITSLPAPDGAGDGGSLPLPGGIAFTLPPHTVVVASLRFVTSLELRALAITERSSDAEKLAGSISTFLGLFRSIEISAQPKGPDAEVKSFFDSIAVKHEGKRVELTAEAPLGFVRKMVQEENAPVVAPDPKTSPKATKTKRKP